MERVFQQVWQSAESKTKIIPELSYEEATALTLGGSKVLFPRTMEAARRNGIPIIVSSSLNPELGGTIIRSGVTKHVGPRAISIKEELDYSILTLIGWSIDEAALPLEAFNKGDCFLQFKVPLSEGREWLEKLHLLTN